MDTVQDLLKQSEKLFEDAKAILVNPEATAEEREHVPERLEDAKKLKARAMQLKEIEDALTEGAALNRKYAVAEEDKERKSQRPGQFGDLGEFWQAVANAGDIHVQRASRDGVCARGRDVEVAGASEVEHAVTRHAQVVPGVNHHAI